MKNLQYHTHPLRFFPSDAPIRLGRGLALFWGVLFFLSNWVSPKAHANIGEAYGFGSAQSALGGSSGAAWGFDAYSAYHNPAGLAVRTEGPRLILGESILGMVPRFTSITGVTLVNSYVSDSNSAGSVTVDDYKATTGQSLGISVRLLPQLLNLSVGVVGFIPLEQTAYMDTGETYVPEYFLYRARTLKPQFDFGLGAKMPGILDFLHLGVGVHLGFALEGTGIVFMQTDKSKPSSMRFATALKPKAAPYFSLLVAPSGERSLVTAGVVVRLPVDSTVSMILRSAARAIPNVPALDFNFLANSSIYYDPLTVELGATLREWDFGRTFVQAEFQNWHLYKSPALLVQDPSVNGCTNPQCGVSISDGWIPSYPYRNIWVARVGQEFYWRDLVLRAGYGYRPSILSDVSNGAGNYLDPAKHQIALGAGYLFRNLRESGIDLKVDAHFAYHALVTETIAKTAGNERSTSTGGDKIGTPGYSAGGSIIGGGLGLSLLW